MGVGGITLSWVGLVASTIAHWSISLAHEHRFLIVLIFCGSCVKCCCDFRSRYIWESCYVTIFSKFFCLSFLIQETACMNICLFCVPVPLILCLSSPQYFILDKFYFSLHVVVAFLLKRQFSACGFRPFHKGRISDIYIMIHDSKITVMI